MARSPTGGVEEGLRSLAEGQVAGADACEAFINRSLARVFRERKLKKISFERAIFSKVEEGLIAHAGIPIGAKVTLERLRQKPHAIGVLLNTVALTDPITNLSLAPGATLVELRPVPHGGFAFDFIADDGAAKLSTNAKRKRGLRLGSFAPAQPVASRSWLLLDSIIYTGDPPDSPLPYPVICISFLHWHKCWYLRRTSE